MIIKEENDTLFNEEMTLINKNKGTNGRKKYNLRGPYLLNGPRA